MKNTEKDDYENSKEERRDRFNRKKHYSPKKDTNEDIKRDIISKKELKKKKESYEEEEWEDWDRYYNH